MSPGMHRSTNHMSRVCAGARMRSDLLDTTDTLRFPFYQKVPNVARWIFPYQEDMGSDEAIIGGKTIRHATGGMPAWMTARFFLV